MDLQSRLMQLASINAAGGRRKRSGSKRVNKPNSHAMKVKAYMRQHPNVSLPQASRAVSRKRGGGLMGGECGSGFNAIRDYVNGGRKATRGRGLIGGSSDVKLDRNILNELIDYGLLSGVDGSEKYIYELTKSQQKVYLDALQNIEDTGFITPDTSFDSFRNYTARKATRKPRLQERLQNESVQALLPGFSKKQLSDLNRTLEALKLLKQERNVKNWGSETATATGSGRKKKSVRKMKY